MTATSTTLSLSIGATCAAAGLMTALGTLGGHAVAATPVTAYAGVFFAINIGVSMSAGAITLARRKFPHSWMLIGCRALSSWVVAIAMIMGAFLLRA